MKTVFTTGEAAKICKVSQQTIIRCFDSGQLKGFRVPGSRFRRIPRDQLYSFMRDNGIPTDALDSGKRKILVVDDDEQLVELIVDALERDGRFEIRQVNNGFGAGMLVKEYRPDLIILDVGLPDIDGREACRLMRRSGVKCPIVMLTGQDSDADTILGLDSDADYKTVRTAYRRLAKEHHPDLKQGDKEAEQRFREIQAAYDVLKRAEERREAKD